MSWAPVKWGLAALCAAGLMLSQPADAFHVAPQEGRSAAAPEHTTLLATGDIACDPDSPYFDSRRLCQQDRVGRRVEKMVARGADWFIPLGDVQYETASYADFLAVYHKAFGSVRSVTRPVAGNHEYLTREGRGYFRYFKDRAGKPQAPWRSFVDAAGWRIVLLDSNCEHVGGCGRKSAQGQWLMDDLADASEPCTLAVWHHPLQTSGEYAGSIDNRKRAHKLWRMADAGGVDVVLNGHDHIYERFAKKGGIQQFVVGTGGKNHYDITTKAPGSQVRMGHRYGVLRLSLRDGSYRHSFVTPDGDVFDSGQGDCRND